MEFVFIVYPKIKKAKHSDLKKRSKISGEYLFFFYFEFDFHTKKSF